MVRPTLIVTAVPYAVFLPTISYCLGSVCGGPSDQKPFSRGMGNRVLSRASDSI